MSNRFDYGKQKSFCPYHESCPFDFGNHFIVLKKIVFFKSFEMTELQFWDELSILNLHLFVSFCFFISLFPIAFGHN